MFAFQKWSSLAEMRRYMKRFIHLVDGLPRLGGILRTKYNQYHSVVVPLTRYLQARGVQFHLGKEVVDVTFDLSADTKTAKLLHMKDGSEIPLGKDDCVLVTNGSLTESTDNGAWERPAVLKGLAESGSWQLWKKLAAKDPSFGNPGPFCDRIDLQRWYSFTATLKDRTFHDYMENFSGNVDGTGGLVTLTDSAWLMSFVIARQPHFPNQPDDVKIFWGYGLFSDRKGDFVRKTMAECTGKEMLEELWYHLRIAGTDEAGDGLREGELHPGGDALRRQPLHAAGARRPARRPPQGIDQLRLPGPVRGGAHRLRLHGRVLGADGPDGGVRALRDREGGHAGLRLDPPAGGPHPGRAGHQPLTSGRTPPRVTIARRWTVARSSSTRKGFWMTAAASSRVVEGRDDHDRDLAPGPGRRAGRPGTGTRPSPAS